MSVSDHIPVDDLSALVAGDLDSQRATDVSDHVEACASCRRIVEELREIVSAAASMPVIPAPASFDESFLPRAPWRVASARATPTRGRSWGVWAIGAWAAAASIAAVALFAQNRSLVQSHRGTDDRASVDTTSAPPSHEGGGEPSGKPRDTGVISTVAFIDLSGTLRGAGDSVPSARVADDTSAVALRFPPVLEIGALPAKEQVDVRLVTENGREASTTHADAKKLRENRTVTFTPPADAPRVATYALVLSWRQQRDAGDPPPTFRFVIRRES